MSHYWYCCCPQCRIPGANRLPKLLQATITFKAGFPCYVYSSNGSTLSSLPVQSGAECVPLFTADTTFKLCLGMDNAKDPFGTEFNPEPQFDLYWWGSVTCIEPFPPGDPEPWPYLAGDLYFDPSLCMWVASIGVCIDQGYVIDDGDGTFPPTVAQAFFALPASDNPNSLLGTYKPYPQLSQFADQGPVTLTIADGTDGCVDTFIDCPSGTTSAMGSETSGSGSSSSPPVATQFVACPGGAASTVNVVGSPSTFPSAILTASGCMTNNGTAPSGAETEDLVYQPISGCDDPGCTCAGLNTTGTLSISGTATVTCSEGTYTLTLSGSLPYAGDIGLGGPSYGKEFFQYLDPPNDNQNIGAVVYLTCTTAGWKLYAGASFNDDGNSYTSGGTSTTSITVLMDDNMPTGSWSASGSDQENTPPDGTWSVSLTASAA